MLRKFYLNNFADDTVRIRENMADAKECVIGDFQELTMLQSDIQAADDNLYLSEEKLATFQENNPGLDTDGLIAQEQYFKRTRNLIRFTWAIEFFLMLMGAREFLGRNIGKLIVGLIDMPVYIFLIFFMAFVMPPFIIKLSVRLLHDAYVPRPQGSESGYMRTLRIIGAYLCLLFIPFISIYGNQHDIIAVILSVLAFFLHLRIMLSANAIINAEDSKVATKKAKALRKAIADANVKVRFLEKQFDKLHAQLQKDAHTLLRYIREARATMPETNLSYILAMSNEYAIYLNARIYFNREIDYLEREEGQGPLVDAFPEWLDSSLWGFLTNMRSSAFGSRTRIQAAQERVERTRNLSLQTRPQVEESPVAEPQPENNDFEIPDVPGYEEAYTINTINEAETEI